MAASAFSDSIALLIDIVASMAACPTVPSSRSADGITEGWRWAKNTADLIPEEYFEPIA
jgi:hypothetical protein